MTSNDRGALVVLAGTSLLGLALVVAALIDDFVVTAIGGVLGGIILVFSVLAAGFVLARRSERPL